MHCHFTPKISLSPKRNLTITVISNHVLYHHYFGNVVPLGESWLSETVMGWTYGVIEDAFLQTEQGLVDKLSEQSHAHVVFCRPTTDSLLCTLCYPTSCHTSVA